MSRHYLGQHGEHMQFMTYADVYCRHLKTSNLVLINKTVIHRGHSSTWLIVGKQGQGMRFCMCNSNSNPLVCVTHTLCVSSESSLTSFKMIQGT
jgi:hypothetical protein